MIANDHAAPPGGQGNAFAPDASGSGQETATAPVESGHAVTESFHAESGSCQKTATAHDHEKRATRTMTAAHAHNLLTANGKRSDGDVHASYSHVIEPSYPSSSHAPRSVNRGRIQRGSMRLMTPSNSHVVERAVRIGESQQPRRRRKGASAASGELSLLHLPKEEEKKERARSRQTNA